MLNAAENVSAQHSAVLSEGNHFLLYMDGLRETDRVWVDGDVVGD